MALIPENNRLQDLANKWLKGTITEAEKKEFNEWYTFGLEQPIEIPEEFASSEEEHKNKILDKLHADLKSDGKKNVKRFPRYPIAAMLAIFILTGVYLQFKSKPVQFSKVTAKTDGKIVPGSNKAILTLADGTKINLTDAQSGSLAEQSGRQISKSKSGQLIYTVRAITNKSNAIAAMNTIETPRGGQYQVNLPDGTKVWLNAASSLSFPLTFAANERKVLLTGEAYFEVAKDKAKPFRVEVRDVNVEVLGTHFNVMAYKEDGEVRTTLLEGSVRLNHNDISALLKPGEQGYLSQSKFNVTPANVAMITAWKNGWFLFDNTDLYTLMGQISRWYDVDVIYEEGVKKEVFNGKIARKSELSKVLKILEIGGVRFKIEGHKLIIKP